MAREIKFRGKRKDNGEWVYGYYVFLEGVPELKLEHEHWIVSGRVCGNYEVIPETVGQFTGLQDKNGRDIYEGDKIILSCGCCEYVIIWDDKNCRFFPQDDGLSSVHEKHVNVWDCELEVIGNIHE